MTGAIGAGAWRPLSRPFEPREDGMPLRDRAGAGNFGDVFKKAIEDASQLQDDAQGVIEAFLRGEPVELHQVMAASEEASISIEVLVEIRNKLTEAYRSIMSVQ